MLSEKPLFTNGLVRRVFTRHSPGEDGVGSAGQVTSDNPLMSDGREARVGGMRAWARAPWPASAAGLPAPHVAAAGSRNRCRRRGRGTFMARTADGRAQT